MPKITRPAAPITTLDECPENPIVKRRRGQQPLCGPEGFQRVLKLARLGMTDAEIRARLNPSERTWLRWLSHYTDGVENRELLARVRAAAVGTIDAALFDQALQGKVGAAKVLLAKLMYARCPWQR